MKDATINLLFTVFWAIMIGGSIYAIIDAIGK